MDFLQDVHVFTGSTASVATSGPPTRLRACFETCSEALRSIEACQPAHVDLDPITTDRLLELQKAGHAMSYRPVSPRTSHVVRDVFSQVLGEDATALPILDIHQKWQDVAVDAVAAVFCTVPGFNVPASGYFLWRYSFKQRRFMITEPWSSSSLWRSRGAIWVSLRP